MSRLPATPPRFDFDLPAIFTAAVEYGRIVSGTSDDAEAEVTARARLLRHLNPRRREFGSDRQYLLQLAHPGANADANTPRHFDEVDLSASLPTVDSRTALKTIASAVMLLSGENPLRTRGRELLGSGAWLLWRGMDDTERKQSRSRLPEAFDLWSWKRSKAGVPRPHSAPTHTTMSGLGHIDVNGWRSLTYAQLRGQAEVTQAVSTDLFRHGREVIDYLIVGGGEGVEVTGLSCKVIPGDVPTICKNADPPIPLTVLSEVLPVLRRVIDIPDGLTIHWIGTNAAYRSSCPCHPLAPTAAPIDRDRWPTPRVVPVWDKTQRQLRLGQEVIRNYSKRKAKNQERLLDKFQEAGWDTIVEAPFDGRALKEAIDAFNDTVKPNTIRLRGDGTGKGVSWSHGYASAL